MHRYVKKPENIRQIGESPYSGAIYIEDYVMTYIRRIFKDEGEEKIILLLGKKGEEQAKGNIFIYGAVGMEYRITDAVTQISEKEWSSTYEKIYKYFQGTELLGWVCGVYMWNSKVDATINIIHRKYFSKEENILFLFDLSECEEKIFKWYDGNLKEQSGYYVFYEKNPQMQEFVLGESKNESVDEQYEDVVTEAIRETVSKSTHKAAGSKPAMFVMMMAIAVMFVIGGNYMFESFAKINNLETAVDVLQSYVETTYSSENGKTETATQPAVTIRENSDKTSEKNNEISNNSKRQNVKDVRKDVRKNTSIKKYIRKNRLTADKNKISEKKNKTAAKKERVARVRKNYAETAYETYRVQEGDTLSQIVWRQYHSLDKISSVKKINNIGNSNNIIAGQVIKLPNS